MNIACSICSELFKSEDDLVVTGNCGHCFHRDCVENWFRTSRTCPSCRAPSSEASLVKLYLAFDDAKLHLSVEEVLKNNDQMKTDLNELKENFSKQEAQLIITRNELKAAQDRIKALEYQKQIHDLNMSSTNALKTEAMKETIKLKDFIHSYKLDLMAERHLRRIYQLKLHEHEPDNENFEPSSVELDESNILEQTPKIPEPAKTDLGNSLLNPVTPFWNIQTKPYKIPHKMVRGSPPKKSHRNVGALIWNPRMQSTSVTTNSSQPTNKLQPFSFQAPNETNPLTDFGFNKVSTTSGDSAMPLVSDQPGTSNSLAPVTIVHSLTPAFGDSTFRLRPPQITFKSIQSSNVPFQFIPTYTPIMSSSRSNDQQSNTTLTPPNPTSSNTT